jgi:hypothetical protein
MRDMVENYVNSEWREEAEAEFEVYDLIIFREVWIEPAKGTYIYATVFLYRSSEMTRCLCCFWLPDGYDRQAEYPWHLRGIIAYKQERTA